MALSDDPSRADGVEPTPTSPQTPPAGPPTDEQVRRAEELLRRGADRMRSEEPSGWFEVAGRVTDAVRAAGRRGLEIDAAWPDGSGAGPGDRLRVTDLVVIDALRRALTTVPSSQPSAVALMLHETTSAEEGGGAPGRRCSGARVSLVASYGVDLRAVADHARRVTLSTLSDVLGPPPDGLAREAVVDVEIVDVTREDPRL